MSHHVDSQKSLNDEMIIWMLFTGQILYHCRTLIQNCTHLCLVNLNVVCLKNNQMIATHSCHLFSLWDLGLEISSLFRSRVKVRIRGVNNAIIRLETFAVFGNSFPLIKCNLFNRILLLILNFWIWTRIWFSAATTINLFLSTILLKSGWYEAICITTDNDMAHWVQCVELL